MGEVELPPMKRRPRDWKLLLQVGRKRMRYIQREAGWHRMHSSEL